MIDLRNKAPAEADDLLDIPEVFRSVAREYGRALYEFVMNVQLAGEAADRLVPAAQSAEARTALLMLIQTANANANALAQAKGIVYMTNTMHNPRRQAGINGERAYLARFFGFFLGEWLTCGLLSMFRSIASARFNTSSRDGGAPSVDCFACFMV